MDVKAVIERIQGAERLSTLDGSVSPYADLEKGIIM